MTNNTVKIDIKNLRLRTFIGFNPDELTKQQDVVINISLHYPVPGRQINDSSQAAVDYKQITKKIIDHVEQGRFLLLEKLTEDILRITADHPLISYAQVTVDKPHALRFSDSVAVTLEHFAAIS